VKKAQLIGGVALLVLAALMFLFLKTSASIPAATTLTIVGLVLVATARKRQSQ
jgi:phosphate/sulfate permease